MNKADAKEKLAGLLFTVLSTYIVRVEKKTLLIFKPRLIHQNRTLNPFELGTYSKNSNFEPEKNELETSFFRQTLLMKVGLVLNHLKYTTDGNIVLQKWKNIAILTQMTKIFMFLMPKVSKDVDYSLL